MVGILGNFVKKTTICGAFHAPGHARSTCSRRVLEQNLPMPGKLDYVDGVELSSRQVADEEGRKYPGL